MEFTTLVFVAVLVVLFSAYILRKLRNKNALPGPSGLPILGYLPFLTAKPYVKLYELSKKYGPVYSVKFGSKDVVVLCDFKTIKESFADDAFMGRPPDLNFELSEDSLKTGAFFGMPWKEQRRFALHSLRDLGFGKTMMEEHIKEEILELLDRMQEYGEAPVKMSPLLAPSTSNNIASLLFGKRLKYNDPKRQNLDKLLRKIGRLIGAVTWQSFFPMLGKIMSYFKFGPSGKLSSLFIEVKAFIRQELIEHEKTLDPNNIRDYMDRFLLEIPKRQNDPNTTFKKDILIDNARGFFGAGSETVRISVDWLMLISAAFPQVQDRMQKEIDATYGKDGFPSWQDRFQTPYTEAVIWEMMRWKSIVPINLMRYTLQDTEINGYFVPKHTNVLAVLHAVSHEKKLWGNDVEIFKPERFLTEDGQKVVKPEYFIPFSIGKRSCPGKSLAEVEIYLYIVAILQRFRLSMPPGEKPDFEGILGIGLQPKSQELCLQLRK